MIKVNYRKKLNGYRCSHRNKWLFIKNEVLSIQSLVLWQFYIDISDFDKKHNDYGLFCVDFEKICKIFNNSSNTIRNWHKELIKVGLIKATEDKHVFRILVMDRYISPGFWGGKAAEYVEKEKGKSIEEILKIIGIGNKSVEGKFQSVIKKRKDLSSPKRSKAISSYKDNTSSNKAKDHKLARTEKEYQELKNSDSFKDLEISDMRLIDEIMSKQNKNDDSESYNEQDIVDIFFNGNWKKYKSHLITS